MSALRSGPLRRSAARHGRARKTFTPLHGLPRERVGGLIVGVLAATLMVALRWLARQCPRDATTLSARINAVLPQTQCAQCGYPGCAPYADAIVAGTADIDRCPPGGDATIAELALLLGVPTRPLAGELEPVDADLVACIDESACIGCALCLPACPVDAIAGAARFMHTVLPAQCTGCELCIAPCPVDCIAMVPRAAVAGAMDLARASAPATVTTDAADVRADLVRRLRSAGLVGMGGAGFPTWRKLDNLDTRGPVTLIINAVECEPGLHADCALIADDPDGVCEGVAALVRALAPLRMHLAAKHTCADAVETLLDLCHAAGFELEPLWLDAGYPSGDERNLYRLVTGQRLPVGHHPGDHGVLTLNVATVAAIGELAAHGHLPRARRVTVHGPGIVPTVVMAPVGMAFADVVAAAGVACDPDTATVSAGGAMMSQAASWRTPITLATTAIYITPVSPPRDAAPCIRCNRCVEACPELLPVQDLVTQLEGQEQGAGDAGPVPSEVAGCTGCRCCDVICPSHIAIAALLTTARQRDGDEREARARAERLQARFDAHQSRLRTRRRRSTPPASGKKQAIDGLLAAARARRQRPNVSP